MMELSFELQEADYVRYQLYTVSKSAQIIKKRKRNRALVPVFYAFLALLLFQDQQYILAAVFLFVGIAWFFVYPAWTRQRYIKYYQKFVRENYKDRLGRTIAIDFFDDHLKVRDAGSESIIRYSEMKAMIEISTSFYIQFVGAQSLIIPKQGLTDPDGLRNRLTDLALARNIEFRREEDWEWK